MTRREPAVAKPATDEALAFLPVTHLAKLVETRQVTSSGLTELYLARLKKYDPVLHSIISFTDDLARAQAKEADAEIAAGRYRGPLHGIPFGIKDLFAVRGTKTTWGASPYKDQVIDIDATVYLRLREAGAVLIAKLSSGALTARWFGGVTRNPWNVQQDAAGSSAGPGSATAAGLVGFRSALIREDPSSRRPLETGSRACGPRSGASAGTAPWLSLGPRTRSDRCADRPRIVRWCSTRSTDPTAWIIPCSTSPSHGMPPQT